MTAAIFYDRWATHLLTCDHCSETGPSSDCHDGTVTFRVAQEVIREAMNLKFHIAKRNHWSTRFPAPAEAKEGQGK